MRLGRVIGNIWASQKDKRLDSRRMLLVQPLSFRGEEAGQPITTLDTMDAGVSDVVIYATSAEAAIPFQPGLTPTDATIIGIVDRVDHEFWSYRAGSSG